MSAWTGPGRSAKASPMGTVRLRYPRVADQHWRLQNDRFCDTGEWSGISALCGISIGILNYDSETLGSNWRDTLALATLQHATAGCWLKVFGPPWKVIHRRSRYPILPSSVHPLSILK